MTTTLYNYCNPLSTHSMLNSITSSATNNVQLEGNSHIFTYPRPDTWNKPYRINSGLIEPGSVEVVPGWAYLFNPHIS